MKKIIKSICILSIILLFIFISKKEISNRVYHINNATINYPYFNNKKNR